MRQNIITKLTFFLLFILLVTPFAAAQTFVIKGKVVEEMSGEPIIGVNVIEKNENNRSLNGTVTDINGNFMLKISASGKTELMFSFISYKSVVIPIKNQNDITVRMKEDTEELADVVVTAQRLTSTGIENISQRDLTGSVSTLDMKDIAGLPATNIGEVLQGRVSGVMATSFSGDPGSGIEIQIRGQSSISAGNDPLFVVDGIPVISSSGGGLSEVGSSPLSDIPPEEIESIDVLKDASAVALWGTRAANGVVIIKTKRGETNKTVVGFSTRLSLKVPVKGIPMLNGDEYKTLMNEADQNRGNEKYHREVVTNLRDNVDDKNFELHNNNTDWVDAIENNGYIQNYNFSLSGGGNSVRYRFSTTFEDNRGPIITTAYSKFNTMFNLDYSISNKLAIATNIAYTNSTLEQKDVSTKDGETVIVPGNSIQKTALQRAPTWPIYLQNQQGETLDGQFAFQKLLVSNDYSISNPYAFILNKQNQSRSNRLYGSVRVVLRPIQYLKLQADLGGDFKADKDFYFIPPTATGYGPGEENYNRMKLLDSDNIKVYTRVTSNYMRDFDGIHNVNITLFGSIDMDNSSSISASGNNIASFRTPTLSTAASYSGSPLDADYSESVLTSVGARGQYKYLNRYILSGSLSYDGSSKFGPENRFAMLPTASAKWIISDEWWMSGLDFIDELSLRYSWGINGNGNISNYTFFSRYSSNSMNSYLGMGGIQSQNIRLDNIRWETTSQHNIGLSGAFLKNKVTFDLFYFDKYTNDLLQKDNALPASAGFTKLTWYNAGDVRNRGVEFEFNWDIVRKKDFSFSIGGNISALVNTIEYIPELTATEGIDDKAGGYYWRLVEGDPLGSFYGYVYEGVYATDQDAVVRDADNNIVYNLGGYNENLPFNNAKIIKYQNYLLEGGDVKYKDLNSDGVIDNLDVKLIGDVNPDFYGGLSSTASYKAFTLNLFCQYTVGQDVVNIARRDVEEMQDLSNQSTAVKRRWRKQGDITDIPKAAHEYKGGVNSLASSHYVENATYMRLKSLQLSYFVPRKVTKKLNISSCRLFMVGSNLITWTNYSGQDPEVNGKGSFLSGIDKSLTAQPRTYTFGATIKF